MRFWNAILAALFGKVITIVDPLFGEMGRCARPEREGVWQWSVTDFDWPPQSQLTYFSVFAGDEGPTVYHRDVFGKLLDNWGIVEVELEPKLLKIIKTWVGDAEFVGAPPTIDTVFDDVYISAMLILEQSENSEFEVTLEFKIDPSRLKRGKADLGGHSIMAFVSADGENIRCFVEG